MGAVNEDDLGERLLPRSVRHKRVLDIAAEQPDASMEEIAEEVPSATADLVERVLDDYGDPAEDVVDDLDDGSDGPSDPIVELPDPSELTSTQRETIRQIREHPEETQADIAARLGVTAPTVCNRLNSIEGFDWSKRRAIAASILDPGDGDPEETLSMSSNDSQHQMETDTQDEVELERLAERITDSLREGGLLRGVINAITRAGMLMAQAIDIVTENLDALVKLFAVFVGAKIVVFIVYT